MTTLEATFVQLALFHVQLALLPNMPLPPGTAGDCVLADALFFADLQKNLHKSWVNGLIIPFTMFFAIACIVSLFSVGIKVRVCYIQYHRRRLREITAGSIQVGSIGMRLPRQLSFQQLNTTIDLAEKFQEFRINRLQHLSYIMVALLEDVPMGILTAYYFVRLIFDCIEAKSQDCTLTPNTTIILLLSLLSSAGFCGVKIAYIEVIRSNAELYRRLNFERAALILELDASTRDENIPGWQMADGSNIAKLTVAPQTSEIPSFMTHKSATAPNEKETHAEHTSEAVIGHLAETTWIGCQPSGMLQPFSISSLCP